MTGDGYIVTTDEKKGSPRVFYYGFFSAESKKSIDQE